MTKNETFLIFPYFPSSSSGLYTSSNLTVVLMTVGSFFGISPSSKSTESKEMGKIKYQFPTVVVSASTEMIAILTAQKMKFSIKYFFNKCDQIRRKLRIWSHLLKKYLMENFIFYAVTELSIIN